MQFRDEILAIIASVTGLEKERLDPNVELADQGIDSLQTLDILAGIETRYGLEFEGKDLNPCQISTVAGLNDLVAKTKSRAGVP